MNTTVKNKALSLDHNIKNNSKSKTYKILSNTTNKTEFQDSFINRSRKIKSLTSLKSIDDKSKFRKYMVKEDKNGVNITIIPQRTYVYQGVNYEFKPNLTKEEYMNDIYNVFNGAFFVSTNKVASNYGLKNDYSNIVYLTIPTQKEINKPTNNYKYIYPLYYIPGKRGSDIKYKLKKDLFLIDIGDIKNIRFLWLVLDELNIDKNLREEYKEYLLNTCVEYKPNMNYDDIPSVCKRISLDIYDKDLVKLFKNVYVPIFKTKYNLDIDGWIYYESNDFHDEIMILSNEHLDFVNITTVKPTTYNNIPTIDEFIKSMESKKILNTKKIKYNTILSNYVSVMPSNNSR